MCHIAQILEEFLRGSRGAELSTEFLDQCQTLANLGYFGATDLYANTIPWAEPSCGSHSDVLNIL
jgi:hypothetical protein